MNIQSGARTKSEKEGSVKDVGQRTNGVSKRLYSLEQNKRRV